MKARKIAALAVLFTLCAGAAFAQAPDARVKKLLDTAKLYYEVNDYGNYRVLITLESDPERTQLVLVMSVTEDYFGTEIREIVSVAGILPDYPDEYTMYNLMEENWTNKIGAWSMVQTDEGDVAVYYTVKVPANLSPKDLNNLINFVAKVCDKWEEEYLGGDDY